MCDQQEASEIQVPEISTLLLVQVQGLETQTCSARQCQPTDLSSPIAINMLVGRFRQDKPRVAEITLDPDDITLTLASDEKLPVETSTKEPNGSWMPSFLA